MSKKSNAKSNAKTSTPKVKAIAAPVLVVDRNPGVEVRPAWLAIRAGLAAVNATPATADDIEKAVPAFLAAGQTIAPASDGTVQTGRFTGLRIMEFQDRLYGHNQMAGWGFTDAALATAWRAEFPNAKCNFAVKHSYIGSARGDLNRNKRGTTIEQLRAQFKFEGASTKFGLPVAETVAAK